ncbi:unnamed protein product [Effrenium voratum]|nr:unnamed protein product [Effrenium voratum]
MPGMPWSQYCPTDADWCNSESNWCQLPWCYVSRTCNSAIMSSVFAGNGSSAVFYSYDTCLSTPDCFSQQFNMACPFDWTNSGWSTPQHCPESWSDVCKCIYQGQVLPPELYTMFPVDFPGKNKHFPNIAVYGTTCASWDQVPYTPLATQCEPGSNFSQQEYNWCQIPWCYVHASCPSRVASELFKGSMTTFYSYDSCGNAPDCYNNFQDSRCPYDPTGEKSYKVYKGRGCECTYQGGQPLVRIVIIIAM